MCTPVRKSAFSDCLAHLEMKQDALQALRYLQIEEENAAVIKEGEAQLNKVTSVLVEDTQKIISLTSEVDALKVCVCVC